MIQPSQAPADPQPSQPEVDLAGLVPDYKLLRRIGGGSYGIVWLARNVFGELRAVKVISRSRFSDERPFEREFEGIQRFEPISRSHPSQLAILHVGKNDGAGCFYYVMELADEFENPKLEIRNSKENRNPNAEEAVEGGEVRVSGFGFRSDFGIRNSDLYIPHTLRHDLERHGRLPISDCVQIGLSLTTALAHLHQHGLVHRDIKPSNVIFVNGVPKLGDIGLVTEAGDTHSIVGTEGYLPPEGPGTPQADIFSLGKVLYEISTGMDRRRFAELPEDLRSWPDRRDVAEFNEILLKACAKDLARRYQSIEQMRADFALLQRGKSVRHRRNSENALSLAKRAVPMAALLALLAFVFLQVQLRRKSQSTVVPEKASIFVLPFRNDGTNQVDELLRSRITDATLDGLAQIEGVHVGPRRSAFLHRNEDEVRREIGTRFKMRYELSGRVATSADSVSIRVALFDTVKDKPFWSEAHRGQRDRLGVLEKRIIESLASALGVEVVSEEWKAIETRLANNLAAYEAFKATPYGYAANKAEADVAIEVLNRATELDPNFVEAYLRLAHHYRLRSDVSLAPKVAVALERKAVLKALEIDPTSAQALTRLAGIQCYYDWDWANAERNLQRAIQLSRSESNGNYACLLETLGRWDEALRIWKAVESQAPTSDFVLTGLHTHYFLRRQYDDAMRIAQKGIDSNPSVGVWYWMLGRCHEQIGDYAKAVNLIQKAQSIDNEPLLVGFLGHVYAAMGKADEAHAELLRLEEIAHHRYVPAAFRAFIHVGLGEINQAFVCLDQAYHDRSETLVFSQSWPLKYDPIWDPLRSDPRYTNLLRNVNLAP